jgi:hypothetical protein
MLLHASKEDTKRFVTACVGRAMADRFVKWLAIYRKIPAAEVITKGKAMDFSSGANSEPSFVYASVFCVGSYVVQHRTVDAHLPNITRFLRSPGLDPEYQLLFLRQVHGRSAATFKRLRQLADFRALAEDLVGLKLSGES